MRTEWIEVADGAGVTTITPDRPEVTNAVHTPMHHELQAALDAFARDRSRRVCVLTGAGGRTFCAGSDLNTRRRWCRRAVAASRPVPRTAMPG